MKSRRLIVTSGDVLATMVLIGLIGRRGFMGVLFTPSSGMTEHYGGDTNHGDMFASSFSEDGTSR